MISRSDRIDVHYGSANNHDCIATDVRTRAVKFTQENMTRFPVFLDVKTFISRCMIFSCKYDIRVFSGMFSGISL